MKKYALFLVVMIFGGMFSTASGAENETLGTEKTFTITGYYSPLPHQNFYITGSYESEIRLNGHGIAGADGTGVYPGMIAAPSSYDFGTIICLPDLGCGKVHDRGGAIVEQGERKLAQHDRLDIWMGYGEEGLLRALSFGVKHLKGTLYPKGAPVEIFMNFEVPPQLSDIVDLPQRRIFDTNLSQGDQGEKVKALQETLQRLDFYAGEIDGIFDEEMVQKVFEFQRKNFIVEKKEDLGAGLFGPQTRSKITSVLYKKQVEEKIREAWEEFHFENSLNKGARSGDVFKLQQILVKSEFMTVNPTGYFGPITQKALMDFQIAHGIIPSKSDPGAGIVGPQTQEKLNEILEENKNKIEISIDRQIAFQKEKEAFLRFAQKPSTISTTFSLK